MMRRTWWAIGLGLALGPACGDRVPSGDGAGDGSSEGSISDSQSGGSSAVTNGGSGSGSADSTTANSSSPGTSEGSEGSEGGNPIKLDLGIIPDAGKGQGGCYGPGKGMNPDDPEFSYIWIANSSQGTISKLDTQTVTEVGRFITRPDSAGSPSRTSVSLSGNVAVANRNGGVTKIYANVEDCVDANGNGSIDTSDDATFLPWGQDECVAWHAPFNYASQRPVAWAQGDLNPVTCEWNNERLWTSGNNSGAIDVLLLDGDTGVVLDQVAPVGLVSDFYGLYGGAVDGEGNLWATQLGSANRLIRVDIDTLDYDIYFPPSGPWWYGMTVDSDGYVWMCSSTAARFDPMTETFQTAMVGGYTGCMAASGPDGLLWMSTGSGVVGVNRQTLAVEANWPTAGSYGISIDYYGYVWAVANGNSAHRVDPDTGTVVSYNGLSGAYTYSDMTGYALAYAGGGAPSG
ncbi:MAG: hypothetical protein KDK70_02425 [Myxococcales bacterium]|nr:hypothetical protein [Myxococcales bacterium]